MKKKKQNIPGSRESGRNRTYGRNLKTEFSLCKNIKYFPSTLLRRNSNLKTLQSAGEAKNSFVFWVFFNNVCWLADVMNRILARFTSWFALSAARETSVYGAVQQASQDTCLAKKFEGISLFRIL